MDRTALSIDVQPQAIQKQCPHCLKSFWGLREPKTHVDEFCCHACARVYDLIQSCGLESYYRERPTLQLHAANDPSLKEFDYLDQLFTLQATNELQLYIQDIQCSSCIWVLERLPRLNSAILKSHVSMMQNSIHVTFNDSIKPSEVATLIRDLGYSVSYLEHDLAWKKIQQERKSALGRIGVAGFAAGNTMLYAVAVYAGADASYQIWFNALSAVLYLPVIFYSSAPLYVSAWRSLVSRNIGVDLPLCLALFFGSTFSYVSILSGSTNLYFDTLSSLVFLILISRFLLREIELGSKSFLYLNDESSTQRSNYACGDEVVLESGRQLDFDATLLSDDGEIDSSWLTGETKPIKKFANDLILAGSRVYGNPLRFKVLRSFYDTAYFRQLEQARKTQLEKPAYIESADRWARVFLAVVLVVAVILALQGYYDRAMALLVISCPCALSLASPMTYSLAIREFFKRGIILKSTKSLEKLARARSLFFDKTGTLSEGKLRVASEENLSSLSLLQIRNLTYSLERNHVHPIARSLKAYIENEYALLVSAGIALTEFQSAKTLPGIGIEGYIDSDSGYRIQKSAQFAQTSCELVRFSANTPDELLARYTFEDVARSGAAQLVSHLRHRGYNLAILSGDHQNVVTEFAAKIGIEAKNARGDMTAFEKEAVLAKTANSVMIGDGMNDGLALSKANVGILTGEVDSRLNADIFIRDQVMPNLEYLILFSRHTFNVLDQNIAFSAIYNSIGLVAACMGWVSPLLAAVLMPLSAASVFLNGVIQIRFSPKFRVTQK